MHTAMVQTRDQFKKLILSMWILGIALRISDLAAPLLEQPIL